MPTTRSAKKLKLNNPSSSSSVILPTGQTNIAYDYLDVLGITGAIGYEHEVNQCIGLCKDSYNIPNLVAIVAQLNTQN